MASFKGRIILKQYIRNKRKRWGIKFFAKANALSGYIYDIVPYTGEKFLYDKSLGIAPSVLLEFVKSEKNKVN